MKGLIQKDLLLIKKGMGNTLVILAIVVVIFTMMMGISAGMTMISVTFAILILSTFSLDDSAQWDAYALSTPATKQHVVLSKYLTSAVLTAIGIALSITVACITLLFQKEAWTTEITAYLSTSIGTTLCLSAVLLPLIYRFGPERARILLMAVIFVPSCLILLLQGQFALPALDDQTVFHILYALPLLGLVLSVISYFISKAIYLRKEF